MIWNILNVSDPISEPPGYYNSYIADIRCIALIVVLEWLDVMGYVTDLRLITLLISRFQQWHINKNQKLPPTVVLGGLHVCVMSQNIVVSDSTIVKVATPGLS